MNDKVKFYGWTMVVVAWLVLFLVYAPGAFGFSMLIGPMVRSLHMNATQAGMGYSAFIIVMGLSGLFAAWLIHRIGIRWTIPIGIVVFVIGDALMGTVVHSFSGYLIIFGLLGGFGLAVSTLIPVQTLISSWFIKNRGTAMSIMISGLGIGGLVWAIVVSRIMAATHNWQAVWLLFAALALVAGIIAIIFVRNKPADLGQVPDGGQVEAAVHTRRIYQSKVHWNARDVFRTPTFWLIAVTTGIAQGFVVTTMLGMMGMSMANVNIPLATIGFIVGTTGILSLVGNLVAGPFVDRIDNRYVYGVALVLMTIGMWFFNIMGPANVSFTRFFSWFFMALVLASLTSSFPQCWPTILEPRILPPLPRLWAW